jgi:hypothetical protein
MQKNTPPSIQCSTAHQVMLADNMRRCEIRADPYGITEAESEEPFPYLLESIGSRAENVRGQILQMGRMLLTKNPEAIPIIPPNTRPKFDPVGTSSQLNMVMCGRLVCEFATRKMNAKSICLEGPNGGRVKLDLVETTNIFDFGLFPGQIVVV